MLQSKAIKVVSLGTSSKLAAINASVLSRYLSNFKVTRKRVLYSNNKREIDIYNLNIIRLLSSCVFGSFDFFYTI